ncbi:MAG: hypothetical protein KKF27_21865 [Gammaproteobacteria bacterium]|nr:hypothetical protein [Gammaproteobacteria bacterium]MBU2685898.1 hypothetical protein [Gammaproteobacteria bacterium]
MKEIRYDLEEEDWRLIRELVHHKLTIHDKGMGRPPERKRRDQWIGMAGEYIFAQYIDQLDDFLAYRKMKDFDPYTGDGGADFVLEGKKIDVKTSWQYRADVSLERLRMIVPDVRPVIYVYVIIDFQGEAGYLMGWKEHDKLQYREEYYDCPADLLEPMTTLRGA